MTYVLFFLQIVFYTLGAVVICGLAVALCEWLFRRLLGGGAGYAAVKATSIIGTPVHEVGHAIMCLLFGHRITDMKLWQPRSPGGTLGYVSHQYNPKNPYHIFGNLFIGIGPIFSGLGVLTLLMFLCFPHTLDTYFTASRAMVESGESTFSLLLEGLKMLPNMIGEWGNAAVPVWARALAVLVMLSVSLHISLSPADIKGALSAVPLYLVLVLAVTVVASLLGNAAMSAVTAALCLFNAYLMSLFVIVLVFALIQVALAFVVWIIRSVIFGRRSR